MEDFWCRIGNCSLQDYLALRQQADFNELYSDPVYGEIQIGPAAMGLRGVNFCNTEPVQRLRQLHQLGTSKYKFAGAEHTRFTHSVGVAHLAAACALHLNAQQPGLNITPLMVEMLEVAGLCHDIGHGPYSHVFESEFLPAVGIHNWHHEEMSAKLLDHIVDQAHMDIDPEHVQGIKDIIRGKSSSSLFREHPWMLQIVANCTNGIDVDKLDYLLRDPFMTGMRLTLLGHTTDFTTLMTQHCRVVNGHICFDESVQQMVADMYEHRATMHRLVYQHHQSKAAEFMIVDLLKAADPVLHISKQIHSCDDFLSLDDSLVNEIKRRARNNPACPHLRAAEQLRRRLVQGDLYPFVGEVEVPQQCLQDFTGLTEADVVAFQEHNCGVQLRAEDIAVHNMKIDHCKGGSDPMQHVLLYSSSNGSIRQADVGLHRPGPFLMRKVRVFLRRHCRDAAEQQQCIEAVSRAFTRAMQQRYGHGVQLQLHRSSSSSSSIAVAGVMMEAVSRAFTRAGMMMQQQLLQDRTISSSRSSSMVDLLPGAIQQQQQQHQQLLTSSVVAQWSLQNQQQQQQQQHEDVYACGFVPATDDEDDEDGNSLELVGVDTLDDDDMQVNSSQQICSQQSQQMAYHMVQ